MLTDVKHRPSLGVREVASSNLVVPTNKNGAFVKMRESLFRKMHNGCKT